MKCITLLAVSKSFYRLLVMFSSILISWICFVLELCLVLLPWNAIAEEYVEKLVPIEYCYST